MRRLALVLVMVASAPLLRGQTIPGIITITPQNCIWHSGDNPAWAAPNLDDTGWRPYTQWKLNPDEPRFWVRCHADLSSLRGLAHPAIQVALMAAYKLYVDGSLTGAAGSIRSGRFNMNTIRSFPLSSAALHPATIAVRITLRTTGPLPMGTMPRLDISLGPGSSLSDRRAAQLLTRSDPDLLPAVCFSVVGVIGIIAFGLFLYDPTRRELFLLALISVCLACIYLGYLLAAALVPIPSVVYAIGWSCPALLLAAARPVFFFALARRPVPRVFWILITLASVLFILPVDVCAFLPPASALWLEAFRVRYMLAPGNLALMFTSAAPFVAFWPYSRITRRMWPLAALCFLFGAIVIAFFAVRATGLVNIPGIPDLVSRWGSTVSETEAVVVLCVMATLFALLFLDQRKVAEERATLAGELLAAREIQRLLVPARLDVARCLRIEAAFRPAQEVGGDFYRCRVLSSGIQRILLGDVSGKGAPAAMTASLLLGAAEGHDADSPTVLLSHLNRAMLAGNVGGFATCLCADISPSGSVAMANAGHLPPYCNGSDTEPSSSLPLGLDPNAGYAEISLALNSGDTLTFLSDGVVEAQSSTGELFGFDRTRAISTQSAEEIAAAAQAFGQEDDITVLTLTFTPAEVLHA
ncbi:MAG TPA: PP2C family protein-serine/threonine phosphatase [Acidobacteriaceae bacterium]|nr:PP2C family protein-serine/threonine phosphatase [Acidobacteriaceae bacterium]